MIINIRGTSGSGKSTLARRLMALYPSRAPNLVEGRRQPISYILSGAATQRPLFVLGHYEIECGGADTVSDRNEAFGFGGSGEATGQPGLLRDARELGCDILFEGVVFSDEVTRTIALCRGHDHAIIQLATPIEECIAGIQERRQRTGNVRPWKEDATRKRVKAIDNACRRLRASGLRVEKLGREAAFLRCAELLGLGGGQGQEPGVSRLADGCCSASSPCAHQKADPTTICEVCQRAAEQALRPHIEQLRGEQ